MYSETKQFLRNMLLYVSHCAQYSTLSDHGVLQSSVHPQNFCLVNIMVPYSVTAILSDAVLSPGLFEFVVLSKNKKLCVFPLRKKLYIIKVHI